MGDDATDYSAYEERFLRLVGDIVPGQYGRYNGRLIRRLDTEQFQSTSETYGRLGARLNSAVMSGDTIDEGLTVQLRALEVSLVIENSDYFI